MLRNLMAEMARKQVTEKDIANLFDRESRWAKKRIREEEKTNGDYAQFGTLDLKKIKNTFFPDCSLEYLSESDKDLQGRIA